MLAEENCIYTLTAIAECIKDVQSGFITCRPARPKKLKPSAYLTDRRHHEKSSGGSRVHHWNNNDCIGKCGVGSGCSIGRRRVGV